MKYEWGVVEQKTRARISETPKETFTEKLLRYITDFTKWFQLGIFRLKYLKKTLVAHYRKAVTPSFFYSFLLIQLRSSVKRSYLVTHLTSMLFSAKRFSCIAKYIWLVLTVKCRWKSVRSRSAHFGSQKSVSALETHLQRNAKVSNFTKPNFLLVQLSIRGYKKTASRKSTEAGRKIGPICGSAQNDSRFAEKSNRKLFKLIFYYCHSLDSSSTYTSLANELQWSDPIR